MIYINDITHASEPALPLPLIIDGFNVQNPTPEDYARAGWREQTQAEADAEAKAQADAKAKQDAADAEAREAAYQAQFTTEVLQQMSLLRDALRRNFGANAETNHAVTSQAAAGYFLALADPTTVQLRDADALQMLFGQLAPRSKTGYTWDLPWGLLP